MSRCAMPLLASHSHSSGGGASASSYWGWASGSVCVVDAVSRILVPDDTAPKIGDATAHVTKQLRSNALHYDILTPSIIVTHNTGGDHYYLHATHECSPITIYTFTTYPGLQPPRHHPPPAWKHPLHVTPIPRKRPTHHVPPPTDSTALHGAFRQAAAQHQSNLLPRISA